MALNKAHIDSLQILDNGPPLPIEHKKGGKKGMSRNCKNVTAINFLMQLDGIKASMNIYPEKKLLVGVLSRAIVDATDPSVDDQHSRIHEEARKWINSLSAQPFSFEWICEHLGVDWVVLRKSILESSQLGDYCTKNRHGLDGLLEAIFLEDDRDYEALAKIV